MISKGFYFSSKIEKNKGDRDFKALIFDNFSTDTTRVVDTLIP